MTQPADRSSGSVEHVLLTRFNVRMASYEYPPESWLDGRIDLFERYCLPSVSAQWNKDFRWLLFFDGETSEAVRRRMADLNQDGLFEVVYVDGMFTAASAARRLAASTAEWLITTRLDNDDAIAVDFTATVRAQFAEQQLEFVNIVSGAQLWARRLYQRPYTKNPFVSLVEQRGASDPRTVFAARHFAVDEVGPVRNVRTSHPSWLQVIHGDNVLNEVVGLRTRGDAVAPWFGCALDTDDRGSDYLTDRLRGMVRIGARILRQPHRIVELGRALLARRGGGLSAARTGP